MNFQPMDPEAILALLEEKDEKGNLVHQDTLTPILAREDATLKRASCPVCGKYGSTVFLDAQRPFTPGSPLPNRLLRCLHCDSEFDPFTRFIRSTKRESS